MSVNITDDSEVEDADEQYRYTRHATVSVGSPGHLSISWAQRELSINKAKHHSPGTENLLPRIHDYTFVHTVVSDCALKFECHRINEACLIYHILYI